MISGNTGEDGGGGVYNAGQATVFNSTISGNTVVDGGGGIYNTGQTTVFNSTISGNTVTDWGDGGGVKSEGVLTLSSVTISDNSTTVGRGGGLMGDASIKNTIIAENRANGPGPECFSSELISYGYNLIPSLLDCNLVGDMTGMITGKSAQLNDLADNGGPTSTHGLQTNSPAIDSGDCLDISGAPLLFDQRGESRPKGDGCDIGAFELEQAELEVNYPDGDQGSRFNFSGQKFINNEEVGILVNGYVLSDSLKVDPVGDLAFQLDTVQAEFGIYHVIVSGSRSAKASFLLAPDKPQRSEAGSGPVFQVPAEIAIDGFAYLPLISRDQTPVGSPILRVNTTDDELNEDGDCSLREAIRAANIDYPTDACPAGSSQEIILLPAGTYTLTVSGVDIFGGDLDIKSNLMLRGGGSSSTIIDGDGIGGIFNIHAGAIVEISGVTISGGSSGTVGGVINNGELTLNDFILTDNSGPGIVNAGTLSMTDCSVSNSSATKGGGISNSGTLNLADCWITNNYASEGGGIYNTGSMVIENSVVSTNTTRPGHSGFCLPFPYTDPGCGIAGDGGLGGGIFNSGDATLRNSTIEGNATGWGGSSDYEPNIFPWGGGSSPGGDGGSGGGIFNQGSLWLYNSTVSQNSTGGGGSGKAGGGNGGSGGSGSGIYNEGAVELTNSTVSLNSTGAGGSGYTLGGEGGSGGGILNSGTITIHNSTISTNNTGNGGDGNAGGGDGGDGGGLFNQGTLTLEHSTVSFNQTGVGGAGTPQGSAGLGGGAYGEISARNSILSDNTATGGSPQCTALNSFGYNLIRKSTGCVISGDKTGNITQADARLKPLEDNGGVTLTHALKSESPAINAGVCTDIAGNLVVEDQRGVSRPQEKKCDIGAFEREKVH